MTPKLCMTCGVRPKFGGRHRCLSCYTRTLGVVERIAERDRRAGMVPDALRRKTVPAKLWPQGTRWCAGCQTFADLEDFGKGASQCKACVSAKSHAARVQKVYGIDSTEYDRLLELQSGRCAICRRRPGKKRLAVDHSHTTGAVRGLLDAACNHGILGEARDNVQILKAAVAYLETPPTSGLWRAPEEEAVIQEVRTNRLIDPDQIEGRRPRPEIERIGASSPILLGGGKDDRGFYRIYAEPQDTRPPF